jgi:Fur family ferric uptake transcriptional regulator
LKHETIRRSFEDFLKTKGLRLTRQRSRIFEAAFATHDHFTAEGFLGQLAQADVPKAERVSRATVYRALGLLTEGGFLELLDFGSGEAHYEHVIGHKHHDHLICTECGRIEEFVDERIEELQMEIARSRGFELTSHDLRLLGVCKSCRRKSGK